MAHIHLEDGSFTLVWVILWWIIALALMGIALFFIRHTYKPNNKAITMAAFITTAAFAVFQISVPVFGGVHLNLTPLVGILAGPFLGMFIVLVVNIFSAAIGHGGWGLVGANVVINSAEVIIACAVFAAMKKVTKNSFSQAGIATFAGLAGGNILMILIILVSGIQGVSQDTEHMLMGLLLIAGVNMGVAVIEAIITGFIIEYLARVRPDMLRRR